MGTLALGCFLLLPHAQAVAVASLRRAGRVSLAPPLPLPSRSLPPSLSLLDEPRSLDRSPSETKSPLPSPPPVSSGLLVLCLVPLAWGTYGPAIKALYALDAPPPELLFSVLNYCVSSSALLAVSSAISDPPSSPDKGGEDNSADNAATGPLALLSSPDVAAAGLELSAYLFVGSTVQLFGIQRTTAGRAAFIVQLTTVIVPLLDAALARTAPAKQTIALCVMAFAGVALMVTAGTEGEQAMVGHGSVGWKAKCVEPECSADSDRHTGLASTLVGDAMIALSAVAYSLHVVRLGYYAPRVPAIQLARAKEVSRLVYAVVTLGVGLQFSVAQSDALTTFVSSFNSRPEQAAVALALICWSGVVTTAFASWGQSFGQSAVSPGTASVIYASQPIWSAVFGYAFLGETLGPQALLGASVVLLAVGAAGFTSAMDEREQRKCAEAVQTD